MKLATSLNALLKKSKPVKMELFVNAKSSAFRIHIKAVAFSRILALPSLGILHEADTDASDRQVGFVPFHVNKGF